MSFHPSPSIDCHMTPMEVVLPFIQESEQNQNHANNNGVEKSRSKQAKRNRSASVVPKTCCDYHSSSGQYIFRCPPTCLRGSASDDSPLCLTQIITLAFYQALLSEFIGTLLLTLVCTSTGLPIASKVPSDLHGALVGGLGVATLVVGFGHVSGAHINPAVTVSFLAAGEIDLVRAICYIAMQLLGAVGGSCILSFLAPADARGNLGMTTITKGVTVPQAILVEFIITFMLCYTVHAICDKRREDIGGSKALIVGLAVIVGCLFGGPYTGASMNPARSFGPATVMNSWKNHWVYWVGPLSGAVAAAITYFYILKQQPPIVVHSDSRPHSFKDKATLLQP